MWLNVIPCNNQVLSSTSKIHLNINTAKEENFNTEVINWISLYHDPFVCDPEINENHFLYVFLSCLFASCLDYRIQEIFFILLDNITSRRRKMESTHHPLKQWELGTDLGCKSQVLSWWESGNCHGTYENRLCRGMFPQFKLLVALSHILAYLHHLHHPPVAS